MDKETAKNGQTLKVDSVNQRNAPLTRDNFWQNIEGITFRQGKRTRIEGKRLISWTQNTAVVNVVGFGDKVIIQTLNGVFLNDI